MTNELNKFWAVFFNAFFFFLKMMCIQFDLYIGNWTASSVVSPSFPVMLEVDHIQKCLEKNVKT